MNRTARPDIIQTIQNIPRKTLHSVRSPRDGAALPLIAVVMVILLVAAALSIDVAKIHVVRSELRTATDAAAKAAVEALSREQTESAAIDAALNIARLNTVDGQPLNLDPSNILFGFATSGVDGGFEFTPGSGGFGDPVNAVRVTGKRTDDSPDGPVNLLFGKLFGRSSFQPQQTAVAASSERDIALVLDVSGSMADFGRFPALASGVDVFLSELASSQQEEHVSLAVYSTTARKRVDLTPNLDAIRTAFAQERPEGFTAIGQGLQVGMNSLLNDTGSRPFALKNVVLMTDGNHNRGVEPAIIAQQCADNRIQVHTITFSRDADLRRMRDVARIANGIHLHADNNQQLVDHFRTIARQLKVVLVE